VRSSTGLAPSPPTTTSTSIRMFDMDGNGYFDRWEIYLGDDPIPKRVSTVRDEKAESMDFDLNVLSDRYTKEILPEAIAANQKFIDAMSNVYEFNIPEDLRYAINTGSDNFRRYAGSSDFAIARNERFEKDKRNGDKWYKEFTYRLDVASYLV
jgi:hypothetical protein